MRLVQASIEVLHAELKLTREDLHRVACELKGRAQRVATLRAKHDTLLAKHGADAEEESQSQVPYCMGDLYSVLPMAAMLLARQSMSCRRAHSPAQDINM